MQSQYGMKSKLKVNVPTKLAGRHGLIPLRPDQNHVDHNVAAALGTPMSVISAAQSSEVAYGSGYDDYRLMSQYDKLLADASMSPRGLESRRLLPKLKLTVTQEGEDEAASGTPDTKKTLTKVQSLRSHNTSTTTRNHPSALNNALHQNVLKPLIDFPLKDDLEELKAKRTTRERPSKKPIKEKDTPI